MKSAVFPMAPAARRNRQSMALILTLAILALLSILLVAFVSTAALDRGATASYSQALPADQVALGGLDQVVSQFQAEITDTALSANYPVTTGGVANNLYIPLVNANAVPQRTAPAAANLATLLSYSGVKLYTSGSGASDYSSSSLTATPSLNGRSVSTANWNKPQLTTSTANFPSPKWILMTRCGPTNGSGLTMANNMANNSALNANYVIGRYAYIVYDTSGLLDANVAGYPSTASTSASGKGLVPWADLTQIPATTGSLTQPDIDSLVNFRNATTVTNYAANVANASTTNGFTRVANGDTTFLGRQDLIKYATTQNTDLAGALPYLTTFSRELNGPTWGPVVNGTGASYQYATSQYTAGSINPRIPNPRVQTGGWARANGLLAVAGEPLVKYRFPLDKLALLEKYMGTGNGSLTASDISSIQQYFGLDLGTNSVGTVDGNGPSYRHWTYPTASTTYKHGIGSGTSGIMSLDDVAAQNREPDFFELLQAGMLSGSLGAPGNGNKGRYDQSPAGSNGYPGFIDPDDKVTLQILRTGANIIDQWDADSFPTTITYLNPGGTGYINLEGIEDLPYPLAAYLNFYSPNSGTTGTTFTTPLNPFEFFLYFELWNPHQMPASPVATSYPTGFRFCPYYNNTYPTTSDSFVAGFNNSRATNSTGSFVTASWFYYGPSNNNTKNGAANAHAPFYLTNLAPTGIPFSYSPTSTITGYREPTLAVPGTPSVTGPAPWNTIACMSLPALTNFPALNAVANQGSAVGFPGANTPTSAWQCQYYLHMVMPLQWQDAANNWHTYSTFIGMDDPGGAFVPGTGYVVPGFTTVNSPTGSLTCQVLMKSDPRTFRFGVSSGLASPDYNVPEAYLLAGASTMTIPVSAGTAPFGAAAPYALDMWAANDSATTSKYSDVDGILRWGDARDSIRASTVTSPLFSGTTAGAKANRPVILNRPFQSVGELGYVYRDMPWKTLDLSSANSADSGLLDLFTLSEAPVLAGRVSPNSHYPQVLAALISGATQASSGSTVSAANALAIGTAMTATSTLTPFASRADIVNNFMTNSAVTGMSTIKTEQEAAVRAIAESANTRTWNFLIDIVAQSGRYPVTAASPDNFVVEGQRRYWLHIAIDRYTGKVVDKQLEVVNE
jgi:hypothetical protein